VEHINSMKQYPYQKNTGAAMMIVVFFFVFISITIILGITVPVVREFRIVTADLQSKQAYFTTESSAEDAMYRIRNSKQIGSSETLVLGSSSATTTITTISSSQKQISTLGSLNSRSRKIDLVLGTTSGTSFVYGMQVGQGGFDIQSSTITGNVYANGPITGNSSATITGSAISANSPAITADQTNGVGTPGYNVSFGNAAATQDVAQSFQVSNDTSPLNKIQIYIKKVSTPSNATVKIVTDSAGLPSTTVIASGTLDASTVTNSYAWVDVSFTTNPALDIGTTYWLVVDAATSSTKYYVVGASSGGYSNGLGKIGQQGGTWTATTPAGLDYYFSVYLGGVTGLIQGTSQYNQLHVGTVSGTAQAHTANYTTVTGTLYCQAGTGNNKSCTSQVDPSYVSYPISDANITSWQTDAANGGTYTGNYAVGYAGATLGPKKIVGNLTVSGGGILTVTGTLWVTGSITLNGGGSIKLASSYGTNDGVIVADGTIDISGGAYATGSGTTGSYIMIATTNSSDTAASISGGAGAVIMFAPNGTLSISGGASLKEATAYKVVISGGSNVTYESGLSNNNFTTGASGTWDVSSWKETQ
jgi:hypothetical protein